MKSSGSCRIASPFILNPRIPPSIPSNVPSQPLPPNKIQITTPQKQQHKITRAKRNHHAQIPPARPEADPQRFIKLVPDTISTVRAVRRRIVSDVARAAGREESGHVLAAGLAGRRDEAVQLGGRALHALAVQFCGDEAGDEAGEAGGVGQLSLEKMGGVGYVEGNSGARGTETYGSSS